MPILPTQPTPPKRDLADLTILEYGFPKAGKTAWASHFPNSVFLATESGQNAIECFKVPIDSWATFLAACNELAQGGHDFRTIVIDTVDNLWLLCQQHVCGKHKVEHESDLAYGKGYALILTEFQRVLTKLSYGLTHHQVTTLVEKYGNNVVAILKADPYLIVREIPGFGFRRVDQIALQVGTPKEHPSRLRAGVLFCVRERLEQGDCWVGYASESAEPRTVVGT